MARRASNRSVEVEARPRPTATVVVHLAAYRAARRARDVLLDLLHGPPWLLRVDIEVQPSGELRLVATIAGLDRWKEACIPSACNGVEIRTRDTENGP